MAMNPREYHFANAFLPAPGDSKIRGFKLFI